ncbi:UDP-N-acetylmuramate:L-alanyl-gamma-D-glutamyl-meso-diaminopimelate ligase [Allohahella marinimesophila]|uniref:UDP-N-acetylmuramate--L-alanyl-gamma-D-glutamyl-meso-2,6-diaminoheptandioate ligase n=1 Tax=Allohahella marinimesophila TaxID=1054972 RepID=A0ABP7NGX3_9GAMM
MHLHFLGICGTFMGSLALLARELGHQVSGSDQHVYPPMSTQLTDAGVDIMNGYEPAHLQPAPDLVIVGNAMSRGNPAVEYMLDHNLPYSSGPEFLRTQVLQKRWVLAVSGTHGKTTTTTMLTWILREAGMAPGYLIGGVPNGFDNSASLGSSDFFVIEADEYDTAFFDKRSKFVHYLPKTLIINNLEYDHADIFPTLADIQRQFHHLMRILPGVGEVIYPAGVEAVDQVLEQGCWSRRAAFGIEGSAGDVLWSCRANSDDCASFSVLHKGRVVAEVQGSMAGRHNMLNGLAAIAAAHHVGILPEVAARALSSFPGVKRRLELIVEQAGLRIYDDFAHHPTAIEETLGALRARHPQAAITAVIEPRSNTMKQGVHFARLLPSTASADAVIWANLDGAGWLDTLIHEQGAATANSQLVCLDQPGILQAIRASLATYGDQENIVVLMSNGGFGGLSGRLQNDYREPLR